MFEIKERTKLLDSADNHATGNDNTIGLSNGEKDINFALVLIDPWSLHYGYFHTQIRGSCREYHSHGFHDSGRGNGPRLQRRRSPLHIEFIDRLLGLFRSLLYSQWRHGSEYAYWNLEVDALVVLGCLKRDSQNIAIELKVMYGPYQQCANDALLKNTNPSENILIEIMEMSAIHGELHNDGFI
ncbi:hypothetical protein OUZ56_002530 [Daphnia magna]|uniref:Uncharacterized protein n=1 Tax=Daphnia magna TaxID=35525 RepID=A0ABR0A612_9CRUS|nr:hypothetical protein OUZ56_002530 [Daphnia magna]